MSETNIQIYFVSGLLIGFTPMYNATKCPTCLLSCNDHLLVKDNHPSWTSWSLCEEGVDHRDPCPLTLGLEHTK